MKALIERYRKVGTAQVSDAQRRLGLTSLVMNSGLRPVWPVEKLVGPAYTGYAPPGTSVCDQALNQAPPGWVLVLSAEGQTEYILWGEQYSARARLKGLAGLVLDGAVRDVDGIARLQFPVYARSITPRAVALARSEQVEIPLVCGGVLVYPGDLIVADQDGIVVVRREEAERILEVAEEIEAREAAVLHAALQELEKKGG
ncbi:MAG TPA: RraA family protein [Armatimonadetes bacterium]|nr:RraA family protein [Armatimonadota bacterium]